MAHAVTLVVHGLNDEMKENVTRQLQLQLGDAKQPAAIQAFMQTAPEAIKTALAPFGYLAPKVHSKLIKDQADFWITLGAPVRITEVSVQVEGPGRNNPRLLAFKQAFPLQAGMVFNAEQYADAKEKLFQVVNNEGYIKAWMVKNAILINRNTNQAQIILQLATGERYYFGRFTFKGSRYNSRFLHSLINVDENTPFSSTELITLQQALASSRFFQQAIAVPHFNETGDYRVPVEMQVTPPKAKRYLFGLGYGTFTGPRITAGLNLRQLNNRGHQLEAQLKWSSVLKGLAVKYLIPGSRPLIDTWSIGANYQKFEPKNGHSTSRVLTGGYQTKWHDIEVNTDLNYLVEDYKVTGFQDERSELLYPHLGLTWRKADDFINPHQGISVHTNLQGASEYLFSSTRFLQGDVAVQGLLNPWKPSRFVMRTQIGYTVVHDLKDLPLTMRYFAGGVNSVRGYPDSGIGPGRYLTTASLEYQHQVYQNWYGAVFYDAGAASDHFANPIYRGNGVGVVYDSVIGPIKVYVARALDKSGHPLSFEFSLGPNF